MRRLIVSVCIVASAILGGAFFGGVGALVGLATGLMPPERWERVVVQPRRLGLDVAPAGRGARVGLSVAF